MANKSNTTFGFILANHPNRLGFYPVMFRITKDRKTKRVKTGLEVKKADWNQKAKNYNHFRSSFPDHKVYNNMLEGILKEYRETFDELKKEGAATPENIIDRVKNDEVGESFLQYAKDRTQEIYDAGGFRNWKKYNGFCNKLEAFLKKSRKKDVTFAEITPSFLSKFDAFLHKLPNERQPDKLLHPNTIMVNFNIFKTIVNRAIEIDNKMKPENNPFMKFKYSGVKVVKEKLDASELDKMLAVEYPEGSLKWHCRNYFFFSFYCAGIRVGDLVQLRWCNITSEKRLNYQMGKNHKVRDLALTPEALAILKHYERDDAKPNDYIFPLLDNNTTWAKYITQSEKDAMKPDMKKVMFTTISAKTALINKELALIAKDAGIDKKVSFHISRHSFAKAAKDKGLDNLVVKELLAHTNLSTTQRYMGDFDTAKTDEALQKAVGKEDDEDKVLNVLKGIDPDLLKSALAKLGM